jgi:hypothetical protein
MKFFLLGTLVVLSNIQSPVPSQRLEDFRHSLRCEDLPFKGYCYNTWTLYDSKGGNPHYIALPTMGEFGKIERSNEGMLMLGSEGGTEFQIVFMDEDSQGFKNLKSCRAVFDEISTAAKKVRNISERTVINPDQLSFRQISAEFVLKNSDRQLPVIFECHRGEKYLISVLSYLDAKDPHFGTRAEVSNMLSYLRFVKAKD